MNLSRKVSTLAIGAAAWVGVISAQAADLPGGSLAATTLTRQGLPAVQSGGRGAPAAQASSASSGPVLAAPATDPSTSAANAASAAAPRKPAPAAAAPAPQAPPSTAYAAGGSMASSSTASQLYAQSTQAGWGCQAALQYLAQHANPSFALVCPGNAMGHQAMTCVDQPNVCPDTAEIVIADPCPAAYKNEAWNSWHMETGPFDPYGWCSDWGDQHAPSSPPPLLSSESASPGFIHLSG